MNIAVIGAGNGGQAAAADMARKGHNVRLYEDARFADKIKIVFDTKTIELSGAIGEGPAKLEKVTSDAGEAIDGAEVIIIAAPAFVHASYCELLADKLRDGQTVLFLAGALGSLVLRETMRKKGIKTRIYACETHTLPYKTRLLAPGKSLVMGLLLPQYFSALPASDTDEVMKKLSGLYQLTKANSVAECALSSLNPITHVPTCLLNSGAIEKANGNFLFYSEGITPCVGGVIEKLDEERRAIVRALGYEPEKINAMIAGPGKAHDKSVYEIFAADKEIAGIKAPSGLKDRYYTEDIPFGLVTWSLLAEVCGVRAPLLDALITLGGAVMNVDCRATGRTAAQLGIQNMDKDRFKKYIH